MGISLRVYAVHAYPYQKCLKKAFSSTNSLDVGHTTAQTKINGAYAVILKTAVSRCSLVFVGNCTWLNAGVGLVAFGAQWHLCAL